MRAKQYVCTTCGYVGATQKITKGSIVWEIILWLCFFVPGFFYSVWRITTKYDGCPKCKNASMIPADSPVGQKIIAGNK